MIGQAARDLFRLGVVESAGLLLIRRRSFYILFLLFDVLFTHQHTSLFLRSPAADSHRRWACTVHLLPNSFINCIICISQGIVNSF